MILPDRHVGRAEIRLIQLQDMPATFTSFYEVWDKKLSTGASSHAVRKTTMATNVGALQATISYRFLHIGDPQQQQQQQQLQQTEIDRQPMEDDLIFRKHLQQNRDTADILFHKYEEGAHANMDQLHPGTTTQDHTESQTTSSSSANTMIGSLGSWFGKGTASTSLGHPTDPTTDDLPTDILNDLDSSLKTYPLLDTLGSWTVSKETNQILRAIGKLLAAFVSQKENTSTYECIQLIVLYKSSLASLGSRIRVVKSSNAQRICRR
jgi:hypothetical protein